MPARTTARSPSLALIELPAQHLVELPLGDVEIHPLDGRSLRFQDGFCEIFQPVRDPDMLVVALQRVVVGLPAPLDRVGERDQAWPADVLRQ